MPAQCSDVSQNWFFLKTKNSRSVIRQREFRVKLKSLDVLIEEILAENDVTNKDRYSMKPSATDVSEWLNSSAGIDTNK